MKFNEEKVKYLLKESLKDTVIVIPMAIIIVLLGFSLYKLLLFLESYNSILLWIVMIIILAFLLLLLLNTLFLKTKE